MQIDLILAYLQSDMRERVSVKFPESWSEYLPPRLKYWMGKPLLLKKALYGYNFSGKFLYMDIAEFLKKQGLEETSLPGLWVKHLEGTVLRFSSSITSTTFCQPAMTLYCKGHFYRHSHLASIECKDTADWYLQTRIQQDIDYNVTLDQRRYALSMLQRFLPNYVDTPVTEVDKIKCAAPARYDSDFLKTECSQDKVGVEALEQEYGFRFIEVVGALNWLSYTCYEEIYAIRKLCRFMSNAGRPHFQAALHLLHHFRRRPLHSPRVPP